MICLVVNEKNINIYKKNIIKQLTCQISSDKILTNCKLERGGRKHVSK